MARLSTRVARPVLTATSMRFADAAGDLGSTARVPSVAAATVAAGGALAGAGRRRSSALPEPRVRYSK